MSFTPRPKFESADTQMDAQHPIDASDIEIAESPSHVLLSENELSEKEAALPERLEFLDCANAERTAFGEVKLEQFSTTSPFEILSWID